MKEDKTAYFCLTGHMASTIKKETRAQKRKRLQKDRLCHHLYRPPNPEKKDMQALNRAEYHFGGRDPTLGLWSGLTPEQCFPTDAVGRDKVLHSLRKKINRKTASQSECFQYTKVTGKNTFQIQHCIPKQKHDCAKQCAPHKCIGWPS
jgi:hypothetical protein